MLPAIILFGITYVLMLVFSKYRPYIAVASGAIFIITGMLPIGNVLGELDFNVLLMIAGTMGLVCVAYLCFICTEQLEPSERDQRYNLLCSFGGRTHL